MKTKKQTNEVTVNTFWSDLIAAWEADAISESAFKIEFYNAATMKGPRRAKSGMLWLDPAQVIHDLMIYLRRIGRQVTLNRRDIHVQLKAESRGMMTARKRFGHEVTAAWGIHFNESHPLYAMILAMEEHQLLRRPCENYYEITFRYANECLGICGVIAVDAESAIKKFKASPHASNCNFIGSVNCRGRVHLK